MAKRETKAKRERDGWSISKDTTREFRLCGPRIGVDGAVVFRSVTGDIHIGAFGINLPPARAAQFARKVAAIAARAAKEAKDGRA